jgi:hypothetical protein
MWTREILVSFDRYVSERGLHFEAVVIGGAALNLLGVVSRMTKDCDILYPEIPKEIAEASRAFAIEARAQGETLQDDWLNNGPASLRSQLLPQWRSACKRYLVVMPSISGVLDAMISFAPSCLRFVIGALISGTASRLRRTPTNSTSCFHG